MNSKEMYREHILDLYKNPHNLGTISGATHQNEESNPLCGDCIRVQLIINENRIVNVKFKAEGCAISIASASLLTDKIKGLLIEEVKGFSREDLLKLLGIPVSQARLNCALLPLIAINKALKF